MRPRRSTALSAPLFVSLALVLAACGGGDADTAQTAQQEAPPAAEVEADADAAPAAEAPADVTAPSAPTAPMAGTTATKVPAATKPQVKDAKKASGEKPASAGSKSVGGQSAAERAENQRVYEQKSGATDVGITKDAIKLGSINMHGMALANLVTLPMVRGNLATVSAINDRGGVLGRRLSIADCDDGPGEVSRAKACIKKLASQDKVFALVTGVDWATASLHDDLRQFQLPYIGSWAYSQTEWQDPFMFPTHMSMIHEAMANAQWVKNVIAPKTYGLMCLTSPEMQLACKEVATILDASGAKLVKKTDVSVSETTMSSQVLSMRAANPDHIIHYVINPATVAKFMVESQQQGYYPPKGISGNHLAGEPLGGLFGKWPTGRYWTNTTYRLWGPEFMATMNKYARGNKGANHHIVQSGFMGLNMFAQAAKEVGPNLTRERLMAVLGNGTVWQSDSAMDQRFQYTKSERFGNNWNRQYGQGREFMYKYNSTNTVANPDGTPSGFIPDPDQHVIYTWK